MFRNPGYLYLLPVAVAAAWFLLYWAARRRAQVTEQLGKSASLARLIPPEAAVRRRWQAALRLAAIGMIFLALAGPQWGVELVPTAAGANQTVIAIDVSHSMLAEDVKPSRLEKAKGELSLILDQLKGARAGVIAFAGEPVSLCPITLDVDAAKQILLGLDSNTVPTPGTAVGKTIRMATQMLQRYPGTRSIILLTDGEDHKTDPLGAAEDAAGNFVRIFTIGIGSPQGEPLPVKDESGAVTGFRKDKKGGTVISRLDEETLKKISAKTRGAYFRASPGESEALEVARLVLGLDKGGQGAAGAATQYKNRYLIPLVLAFLLLLAETLIPERAAGPLLKRRAASISAALLLGVLSAPAKAATAEGALRRGNRAYNREDYVRALEAYAQAART
jgi:Ca-activated chloride channel homolog